MMLRGAGVGPSRLAVVLGVGLGVVSASTASLVPQAAAASPDFFYAVASADGVRFGSAARGFLVVEEFADVGAPAAQSVASSTDSGAYAALPYPGSTVFAGLDLGAGAGDQYPLAAVSDTARPEADRSSGPVVLTAKSGPESAEAVARSTVTGAPTAIGRVEARASSRHDATGTSRAKAETHVEAFSLGVLRIGAVDAIAEVTAEADGTRTRSSDLEVGGVTIVGQAVGLGEQGLLVAGTTTPLPDDAGVGEVLRDQDITVEYLAPEQTPDGVVSAGVRVTQLREVPSLPEPVEVSYVLGRARVGAAGGAVGQAADADPPGSTGPDGAAPVAAGGGAEEPLPPDPGTAGVLPPLREEFVALPASPPSAEPPVAVPGAADAPVVGEPLRAGAARAALTLDPALFYLVLVLGGASLLGGVQLVRLFGVKVMWS